MTEYPSAAFLHNNPDARIIDVTRVEEALGAPAGTNAVPNDPSVDCAPAFIHVFNFIADLLREGTGPAVRDPDASYLIYVPDGTYHVQQRLAYTVARPAEINRRYSQIRIIGQSRENTVIRLQDGVDFGGSLLNYRRHNESEVNNTPGLNELRNVTIDTGGGNPTVGGVDFTGANLALIENVTIRSGDGQGSFGIRVPLVGAHGYWHDITIDGFDYGLRLPLSRGVEPAIEYLTLRNQHVAGVQVRHANPTIRSLDSDNQVPAIVVEGEGAHVVLLDSRLRGGEPQGSAIDLLPTEWPRGSGNLVVTGHLFVRNVAIEGYGTSVRSDGTSIVVDRHIEEYVSDEVITVDQGQPPRSLALRVKDLPATPWPAADRWANVDDFGAVGDGVTDDADAIQAACDSGSQVIYFPKKHYRVSTTINLPATVRRVTMMYTTLVGRPDGGAFFRVHEDDAAALVVDQLQGSVAELGDPGPDTYFVVDHASPRTVVLESLWGGPGNSVYRNSDAAGSEVFLANVQRLGSVRESAFHDQTVWARWINNETPNTEAQFFADSGSVVWVLGFKSEGGRVVFDAQDGAVLEVLGGLVGQFRAATFEGDPVFNVVDGHLSAVCVSTGPSRDEDDEEAPAFKEIVRHTRGSVTRVVRWEELPRREGPFTHQWVLPLYVGYDPRVLRLRGTKRF